MKKIQFTSFLLSLIIFIGSKLVYGSSNEKQMINFVSNLELKYGKSTYSLH